MSETKLAECARPQRHSSTHCVKCARVAPGRDRAAQVLRVKIGMPAYLVVESAQSDAFIR